jgi:protein TonB
MKSSRLVWFGAFLVASLLHTGGAAILLQRSVMPPVPAEPVRLTAVPLSFSDPATAAARVNTVSPAPAPPVTEPAMTDDLPPPVGSEVKPAPPNRSVNEPASVMERAEYRDQVEPRRPSRPEPRTDPAKADSSIAKAGVTAGSGAGETEVPTSEPIPEDKATRNALQRVTDPGGSNLTATWQSKLLAHLARYKRYPARARARGDSGIVEIRFRVDRQGAVKERALYRGSGNPVLDRAALRMIERAAPLPAPPAGIPDDQLTLVVPVRFALR